VYHFDAHNNYSNVLSLNINTPATCHVLSMVPLYPPLGCPGITHWAGVVPEGTRVPDGYPRTRSGTRVICYPVTAALIPNPLPIVMGQHRQL